MFFLSKCNLYDRSNTHEHLTCRNRWKKYTIIFISWPGSAARHSTQSINLSRCLPSNSLSYILSTYVQTEAAYKSSNKRTLNSARWKWKYNECFLVLFQKFETSSIKIINLKFVSFLASFTFTSIKKRLRFLIILY